MLKKLIPWGLIIIANGEGGVETELGNVDLIIENCMIQKNGSSGVKMICSI